MHFPGLLLEWKWTVNIISLWAFLPAQSVAKKSPWKSIGAAFFKRNSQSVCACVGVFMHQTPKERCCVWFCDERALILSPQRAGGDKKKKPLKRWKDQRDNQREFILKRTIPKQNLPKQNFRAFFHATP